MQKFNYDDVREIGIFTILFPHRTIDIPVEWKKGGIISIDVVIYERTILKG